LLRLTNCTDAGCALQVDAVGQGAPTVDATVGWRLPHGPHAAAPAPDPDSAQQIALVPFSRETQFWQIGVEDHAVTLAVTPIRFGLAGAAVAIEMEGGFEHVSRSHALIVAGKPGSPSPAHGAGPVWQRDDGAGPHATKLATTTMDNGRSEAPIYLDAFLDPSPDASDTLSARILRINATGDAIEEEPLASVGVTLPVVVAGRFHSAAAAHQARNQTACLASSLVLPSPAVFGEARGAFLLVRICTSKALAGEQARKLSSCTKGLGVHIGSWTGSS
jgi:hypothetical protein